MSRKIKSSIVLAMSAAVLAGCTPPTMVNRQSEEQTIRGLENEWMSAIAARDVDKIVAIHAPDAISMFPNSPSAVGSAAIRAEYTEVLKLPGLSLTWVPTRIEVAPSGDIATDYGTYRLSYDTPNGRVNDSGNYNTGWQKINGQWRVTSDAVVSSLPMPTPAPVIIAVADVTDMEMRSNKAVSWGDLVVPGFNPGAKIAVLHGDPSKNGDYTLRLQFPDGYQFPVHWHPGGEHLTVLSGTFLLGMAATVDRTALRTYEPGDFLYIPARMSHFGGARGTTVIQLHGMGPFAINLGTAK